MDVKITLPDDVIEKLGPDLERESVEGVVLLLLSDGRLRLEQAGEALGLDDAQVAHWYAQRIRSITGSVPRLVHGQRHVQLDDLTQDELEHLDRFLEMPPAKRGSGLSDVSVNHDKHLADVE